MKYVIPIILIFSFYKAFAQEDPFGMVSVLDSLAGQDAVNNYMQTAIHTENNVTALTREDITAMLTDMNNSTSLKFSYNADIVQSISYFLKNKKKVAQLSALRGLGKIYFPVFEEYLSKYNLPLELKYLPVVESALIPYIKSPAGARGLWQFMYGTGIDYKLKITSVNDERCNSFLSSDAACRYLQYLHGLYNDWYLALAAYNSGPGNVNKAMKRAGGKNTFWDIYEYLPRETQNYVPRFIVMTFLLNYSDKLNIQSMDPSYFQSTDTVYVKKDLNFALLTGHLDIKYSDLKYFNSQYAADYVPSGNVLVLPTGKISEYIEEFEKSKPSTGHTINTKDKKEEPKKEEDPFGTIKNE